MRRLFGLLVVVALLYGASYAGAPIHWLIGPWSAVAIEHDGSATPMQFGPHLPRPEWVPVYPGATVVQASKVWPARAPSGFHALELATRLARGGEALLCRPADGVGLRGDRPRSSAAQSADGGSSRHRRHARGAAGCERRRDRHPDPHDG